MDKTKDGDNTLPTGSDGDDTEMDKSKDSDNGLETDSDDDDAEMDKSKDGDNELETDSDDDDAEMNETKDADNELETDSDDDEPSQPNPTARANAIKIRSTVGETFVHIYQSFAERPPNIPPLEFNLSGEVIIHSEERFCRLDINHDDEEHQTLRRSIQSYRAKAYGALGRVLKQRLKCQQRRYEVSQARYERIADVSSRLRAGESEKKITVEMKEWMKLNRYLEMSGLIHLCRVSTKPVLKIPKATAKTHPSSLMPNGKHDYASNTSTKYSKSNIDVF